ncbi:MAG: hypothetical protein KIT31_32455 [Deltaproteobacteria bacterium]|nr:hypothetical protein [Deltaproteobacteria bacterium]
MPIALTTPSRELELRCVDRADHAFREAAPIARLRERAIERMRDPELVPRRPGG